MKTEGIRLKGKDSEEPEGGGLWAAISFIVDPLWNASMFHILFFEAFGKTLSSNNLTYHSG